MLQGLLQRLVNVAGYKSYPLIHIGRARFHIGLHSMAAASQSNMERFKAENHTAFVVGYTGEVGKALVKDLSELKIFKKVLLLGRREIPLDVGPEIEYKIVNFDKLEEHADLFTNVDVGFCCLGTTRGKAGKDGFIKVDRDYVLNTAKVAKAQGCKQFSLVSSAMADPNSMFLYTKTKGEAEEGCAQTRFDRLSIYHPGSLLCERQEFRLGEKIMNTAMTPMYYLFHKTMAMPVETLARTMINHVVAPLSSSGPEKFTYSNKDIHEASGLPTGGCRSG